MDDQAVRMQIAETILSQLGGRRVLTMMVGASLFMALPAAEGYPGGVAFRIPSNLSRPRVSKIVIKLNASDLYDVEFYVTRGAVTKLVARAEDVFNDSLRYVIERQTGLVLRPPRVQSIARDA